MIISHHSVNLLFDLIGLYFFYRLIDQQSQQQPPPQPQQQQQQQASQPSQPHLSNGKHHNNLTITN